jgi:ABC-type Fe3+-hydroxamate transport system substrate-binding protein
MTRTVMDLGAGELIVGRTPWCAATDAPVVGTLQDRDLARIVELRPTIIMVQAAELDGELARVAKSTGAKVIRTHIDRLMDVETMVKTIGGELIAAHVPNVAAARDQILADADRAQEQAKTVAAGLGRTLILFGTEPPTAFGTGTYIDDLWTSMGGTNALQRVGYPELALEDIVRLDPQHILLVRTTKRDFPPALEALPTRLKERLRIIVAPTLLEPSSAFLREGPSALLQGVEVHR